MPLLIYGAEITDEDKQLTIDNFTALVDDLSWDEFMPTGVTKAIFEEFKGYYDPDIFAAAGKRIRAMARAADRLSIEERIERITGIFDTFRNPDKETVLTPWRVVNMHMGDCLGGYVFYAEDKQTRLLEPRYVDHGRVTDEAFAPDAHLLEINSKSGLYPLYLAYNVYRRRLKEEMFSPETLEEHQRVWDKVVAENIFVVCKTPMAKAITRRTLLGFRKGHTNMWAPDDLINKIKNQPELFIKKVHDLIGINVKINAIVGNPPYQDMDGGGNGAAATPIYDKFVDVARKISPCFCSMIIPARWYGGGRGLDEFREDLLNETHFMLIKDYPNPKDCFPSANISGGICYFLWALDHNSNECEFVNVINNVETSATRRLGEFDMFIRYNDAVSVVHKVMSHNEQNLGEIISQYMPYGIRSYERGSEKPKTNRDLKLISSRGIGYVPADMVTASFDFIDKYNVIIGKAISGHLGETDADGRVKVLATTDIVKPNEIVTESYLCIGKCSTLKEAKSIYKYVTSKFTRFLLLQGLTSMNITKDRFRFVPLQDFTSNSDIDWNVTVAEVDRQLYAKYGLTEEEVAFIESMIKPM
jgi:hypothetical protein